MIGSTIMARSRASAKQAGTRFETECAQYLTEVLGKKITRMPKSGAQDKGDLYGIEVHGEPMVGECKSPGKSSSWSLAGWWNETVDEMVNSDTDYGMLIIKRFNKPVTEAFCVMDEHMWNSIHGDTYHTPEVCKAVPNSAWGELIDNHTVCSIKRRGMDGHWIVCSLAVMAALIFAERKIIEVSLSPEQIEQVRAGIAVETHTVDDKEIIVSLSHSATDL